MSDRPTVPEVLPLVRAYYAKPGNEAGGNLHIVLDDGNVEDSSIRFCVEGSVREMDLDGVSLCQKLLAMSKTQRRVLYMAKKR